MAIAVSGSAAPFPDQAAVCEQIAEAIERTSKRRETDVLSWRTKIDLGNGNSAVVETVKAPSARRISCEIAVKGGEKQKLLEIIERGNRWYVTARDGAYVCRPYEALLPTSLAYRIIARADLQTVADAMLLSASSELESVDGSVAKFLIPFDASQRAAIESQLLWIDQELPAAEAGTAGKLRLKRAYLHDLHKNGGEVLEVSLEYGYLLTTVDNGLEATVDDLAWVSEPDATAFDVNHADWEDRTGKLLVDREADRSDVIMISHAPIWRVGMPGPEPDLMLASLATGELRRVPHSRGAALAGCFSKDRSRVFVIGVGLSGRLSELVEVDLRAGEQRSVADATNWRGMLVSAALSPDGRTLAVVDAGVKVFSPADSSATDVIGNQINLVDLETGQVRPIGKLMDVAFLNWIPDGSGFIARRSFHEPGSKFDVKKLIRIGLDGKVAELRAGDFPALIENGTKMIYVNPESHEWFTCDLNGQNSKLFNGGMKEYSFPVASPQGDRLVMMYYDRDTGPRPHVIDVNTGKATPVPVGPGLWAMPEWK